MRRRVLYAPHPIGKINVTPLIDVVMCLIIFYLIVGTLAKDRQAQVKLPESGAGGGDTAAAAIIINVLPLAAGEARPRVVVGDVPVAEADLEGVLKAQLAAAPDMTVQLRADRTLPYGAVAPIVDACRRAGLASVKLAAERSR